MSILANFITNNVLKALEEEFMKHEPDIQEKFVEEITDLCKGILGWVEDKIKIKTN